MDRAAVLTDPISVLLVEDSPADARLVYEHLQGERRPSFRLEQVRALEEVDVAAKRLPPDVVLLDLALPDCTGIKTLERLRSILGDAVPVIVVTGLEDENTAVRAVRSGAQDYIVKGYADGRRLGRAIRHVIERNEWRTLTAARATSFNGDRDLERLVERNAEGLMVVDADGVVRLANPAATAPLRLTPQDVVGRPFPLRMTPDRVVECGILDERVVETRSVSITWRGAPALLVSLRETTAKRRMENRLLEIERRYRALLDSNNDGVVIFTMDGRVSSANAQAHRLFGYEPGAMIGVAADRLVAVDKQRENILITQFRRLAPGMGLPIAEAAVRTLSGAEVHVDVSASLVLGDDGRPAYIQNVIRDASARVTYRREIAARLRQQGALSSLWQKAGGGAEARALIATTAATVAETLFASFAGVFDFDRSLRRVRMTAGWGLGIASVVPAARSGWEGTDVYEAAARGQSGTSAGHHERSFIHPLLKTRGLQSGVVVPAEAVDGVVRVVAVYDLRPRIWTSDERHFLDGAAQFAAQTLRREKEEADKKALEARVQAAERMESLGRMASGVANDFNNLLLGVLGRASLALVDPPADPVLRERLRGIETAARNASHVANQLMAHAGQGRFTLEPLDLDEIADRAAEPIDAEIASRAETARVRHGDLPSVEGDRTQLRQAITNLIVNALEATPRGGGRVVISTGVADLDAAALRGARPEGAASPGRFAYVDVADEGVGMDVASSRRLFDPFFTTKRGGRGLGLPAVMGALRTHRGCIQVTSVRGKGTSFRIYLPVMEEPVHDEAETPDSPARRAWRGAGGVLVVDDQPSVREVTRQMLESMGFDVIAASDGEEALARFAEAAATTPLALVDVTMPGVGGMETIDALRAIRPDLAAILMSGYTEEEVMRRAERRCVAGFIQKPFSMETLADKLRSVLASRAARVRRDDA
jgi:PAS domain S-box-containing protein